MQALVDNGDHFIHVVGLLSFRVSVCGTSWPVLVEVVLLHRKDKQVSFKRGTLYTELVFAAIFIAG